jgi:probable rRNA maturation factor
MVEQEGLATLLFCFCGSQPVPREGFQRPTQGLRWPPTDTVIIFHKPVGGLSKAALSRFVSCARRTAQLDGQVNVLVTTSRDLRGLNRQFRGKDEPTDVLSFPLCDRSATLAGDIAISADLARHNARLLGHSPAEEIKILVLHGLLHLAGYDHERDNGKMAREESRLRKCLQLPLALLERTVEPSAGGARVAKPSPTRAGRPKARRVR